MKYKKEPAQLYPLPLPYLLPPVCSHIGWWRGIRWAIESPKSCSKTSETARKLENKIRAVLKVVEIHHEVKFCGNPPSKFGHLLSGVIVVGWLWQCMNPIHWWYQRKYTIVLLNPQKEGKGEELRHDDKLLTNAFTPRFTLPKIHYPSFASLFL